MSMSVTQERPTTEDPLGRWLDWLETIHPTSIDMGLDRVSRVAARLELNPVLNPLVLVGGTNGKGSTVAMLSAIYTAAGYRVGSYCSPHIEDFRERICINGTMVEAQVIVDALAFIEAGRSPESLTYFEYTTLAAMRVFQQASCDVYLMEVGLGGRLDATNIWDADCAVVTSIALDHEEYLGADLSVIATEKAAIARSGKVLVVGEQSPPESLFEFALEQGIVVEHVGSTPANRLPNTALVGPHQRRNAACAVAVVRALSDKLMVTNDVITQGLMSATIPARFEQQNLQEITVIFDVAHNPAGALAVTKAWMEQFPTRRAQIIFACLGDKDIQGVVEALSPIAAAWHCVDLNVPRAKPAAELAAQIAQWVDQPVSTYSDTVMAWRKASSTASDAQQNVLVAGSFYTISEVRSVVEPEVAA